MTRLPAVASAPATASVKPEHALPWRLSDEHHGHCLLVCSTPRAASVAACEDYADAEYIKHSANAYPRLVAALAAWQHWYDTDSSEHNRDTAYHSARALLRELGEL